MAPKKTYPLALILFLSLFLFNCDGGTTEPNGNNGNNSTPEVEEGRQKGAYNTEKNLLDPQRIEFFTYYNRQRLFPFNAKAIAKQKIQTINVQQFTVNENDSLKEDSPVEGLIASKTFQFSFDDQGRVTGFDRRAYILGDPADSTFLDYTYGEDGQPNALIVDGATGTSQGTYTYTEEGDKRVRTRYADPEGISVSYQQDGENNRTYETHFDKNGEGTVIVYGQKGSFPEGTREIVQEEILERTSAYVDYTSAPNLKEVMLIEIDENKPVQAIEFKELGFIRGIFTYNYNEDGTLHRIDFQGVDQGDLRTETRYHYDDFGDLVKVVFNEDNAAANNLTVVQSFQYDEDGRLTRRIRSKKVGVGSTKLDRIDVFGYGE